MTQQPSSSILTNLASSSGNGARAPEYSTSNELKSDTNKLIFKDIVNSVTVSQNRLGVDAKDSAQGKFPLEQLNRTALDQSGVSGKSGNLLPEIPVEQLGDSVSFDELNVSFSKEKLEAMMQQLGPSEEFTAGSVEPFIQTMEGLDESQLSKLAPDEKAVLAVIFESMSLRQNAGIGEGEPLASGKRIPLSLEGMFKAAQLLLKQGDFLASGTSNNFENLSKVVTSEVSQLQLGEKAAVTFSPMAGLAQKSGGLGVDGVNGLVTMDELKFGQESLANKSLNTLSNFDKWMEGHLSGDKGNRLSSLHSLNTLSSVVGEQLAKSAGQGMAEAAQVQQTPVALAALSESSLTQGEVARTPMAAPLVMYGKQWQGDLSQKINWMMRAGLEQAEIQLDPKELGPINIRVMQANGEVQVLVQAQHGQTRELFESNQERLREMLQQQGINLAQFDVQSQSQDKHPKSELARDESTADSEVDPTISDKSESQTMSSSRGLLDLFV